MEDVIAEAHEVAQVASDVYNVVKENANELIQAGQEKGEELVEKGKGIKLIHITFTKYNLIMIEIWLK